MKVNQMHVATSASSVTGSSPSLVAIPSATGVGIDAAAVFVMRFVMIVVVTANTMTTTGELLDRTGQDVGQPAADDDRTEPYGSGQDEQHVPVQGSHGRRGVSTPVNTMSTAPAKAISLVPGPLAMVGDSLQLGAGGVVVSAVGELELGVQAGLVGLGQLDLVLLGEQRVPRDLVQIETERVRGLEVEQLVPVVIS
jgi:hypothetical protein